MSEPVPSASATIRFKDLQTLWAKYEDIAMHFNDLLMRLRSQALAGIAAISTLVGIFTKDGVSGIQADWMIATAIFVALALFWIAIWCLDLLYYNRLLMGAVGALVDLEEKSKSNFVHFDGIHMSTRIVAEFKSQANYAGFRGVLIFYTLVFATIISGAIFCWHMQFIRSA
jgi:hypothetical protein